MTVATLKRTELQAATVQRFGKTAAAWTPRATNKELREALTTGEVPGKFANGNQADLASVIAAAINPLLQSQLDEARVQELIDAKMAEICSYVEAKLAERNVVQTFEVKRPNGTTINVGRTHRQFGELLAWVDAGCFPFLIGAAAKVSEALGRPFHTDSMSEGKTLFDLMGFNDATGKPVHTELRRAWENGARSSAMRSMRGMRMS